MGNDVVVSICVPFHNVEFFFKRTLISLFEQSYPSIEFVFIDDCSTDKSYDILSEVLEEYNHLKEKVKIIRHSTNKGISLSRNDALKIATGDLIMWVDADDYIDRDAVEQLVAFQKASEADIVSFGCEVLYSNKTEFLLEKEYKSSDDMLRGLLQKDVKNNIWGRVYKRNLYKDLCFDERYSYGEDFLLLIKLIYLSNNVRFFNKVLYHYNRCNESAVSKKYDSVKHKSGEANFMLAKEFLLQNGVYERFKELFEIRLASLYAAYLLSMAEEKTSETEYYKLYERIPNEVRRYRKKVDLRKRIVFYIKNYKIIRWYVCFCCVVKSMTRFVK